MNWILFISTIFTISLLPGINMTFAMCLGLSIGYRRTLVMMAGLILSLLIVSLICALGISAIIIKFPLFFTFIKIVGGGYLLYIAYKMFKSSSKLGIVKKSEIKIPPKVLFLQGFLTNLSNPKAWIFMAALFPPFLDQANPLGWRLCGMLGVIVVVEFISLSLYASSGAVFSKFMSKKAHIIEKISSVLIAAIAIWMIFD